MNEQNVGTVSQVIGPVLDVKFADGQLPNLLNALEVDNHGETIIAEVAQHIGDNTARCIAMSSTDGLVRGAKAVNTGGSICVPVGEETLGRMFNLLGQPIDNGEPVQIDSAVAKLYCGRAAFEVCDTALQVMGGIGYTKDCRISRLWRDQRVYRIGAGTDEIMIHIAGRAIQKLYQD